MPAFRRSKTRAKSLALARKTQQQAAAAYGSLHRMFSMVSLGLGWLWAGWDRRRVAGVSALHNYSWSLARSVGESVSVLHWERFGFFEYFEVGGGGLIVCAPANSYYLPLSEGGLSGMVLTQFFSKISAAMFYLSDFWQMIWNFGKNRVASRKAVIKEWLGKWENIRRQ